MRQLFLAFSIFLQSFTSVTFIQTQNCPKYCYATVCICWHPIFRTIVQMEKYLIDLAEIGCSRIDLIKKKKSVKFINEYTLLTLLTCSSTHCSTCDLFYGAHYRFLFGWFCWFLLCLCQLIPLLRN